MAQVKKIKEQQMGKRISFLVVAAALLACSTNEPPTAPKSASDIVAPRLASAVGTSFVIYFEAEDLAAMAGTLNNPTLSNELKNRFRPFWNGGLSAWSTAPVATNVPGGTVEDFACPLCRAVTIRDAGTVQQFVQLLYDVRAYFFSIGQTGQAFEYVAALGENMMPDSNHNGIADDPIAWYGATEPAP